MTVKIPLDQSDREERSWRKRDEFKDESGRHRESSGQLIVDQTYWMRNRKRRRKTVSQVRRCILKRAVGDLQSGM